MGRSIQRVLCVMLCSAMLYGCASTEQRNQALGGLLGAAGGAAIGALAGKGDPAAIAAGAVGGALVGWAAVKLTQYHAEKTRTSQEAADLLGYTQGSPTQVQINGARVIPQTVKEGDLVTFETEYAVAAPPGTSSVPVEEVWELYKNNKLLTRVPPQTVQREPGGWRTKASISAPQGAEPGTYVVKNRVEAAGSYDERIAVFEISG